MHLGGRCLPDVDTGGGDDGVSFVVVARSKRDERGREESSNRFGQGAGESCRATDDNAQSPEMIRTIWVNFKVLYKAYYLSGYHKYEPAVFFDNLRSNQFFEISPLDDHFQVCPFIFLSFPLKAIAVAPLFHSKGCLPPPHPPGGRSRSSVSVGWFSISFSLLLFFLEIGSRAEGERAGARHQT